MGRDGRGGEGGEGEAEAEYWDEQRRDLREEGRKGKESRWDEELE